VVQNVQRHPQKGMVVSEADIVSIAILAGGQSRRMGEDKAMLRLAPDGPTLIELVARAVEPLSNDLMVVAPPERGYGTLLPRWRMVPDLIRGAGPAGGVISALRSARHESVLVLPCDAPLVSPPLIRYLLERADPERPVIPWRMGTTRQGTGPTLEVLHGSYPRSVAGQLETAVESGERQFFRMVQRLDPILMGPDILTRFDAGLLSFRSLNCPEEFAEFTRELFGVRRAGIY
jgi:molybdopterin-guanine dinucleotide biosynthesis protein A